MIRAGNAVILPVFRAVYTKMVSPTKELGQVLVEFAMGDRKPLQGREFMMRAGQYRTLG